jgi:hypothetical protein
MEKKKDARQKLRRKRQPLNPREPKKPLQLNKKLKKIPMKSMNKMSRNCWILQKKRNPFFNNKKN